MELERVIVDLRRLRESLYSNNDNGSNDMNLTMKLGKLEETEELLAEILILMHSSNKADKQLFNKRLVNHSDVMIDAALVIARNGQELKKKAESSKIWSVKNLKILAAVVASSVFTVWLMYLYAPVVTDKLFVRIIELVQVKPKLPGK